MDFILLNLLQLLLVLDLLPASGPSADVDLTLVRPSIGETNLLSSILQQLQVLVSQLLSDSDIYAVFEELLLCKENFISAVTVSYLNSLHCRISLHVKR